jgi:hypothetical protein
MRVTDDMPSVAGQKAVQAVLHRPVLMRTVVESHEHAVALPHDAQPVVETFAHETARAAVGRLIERRSIRYVHIASPFREPI